MSTINSTITHQVTLSQSGSYTSPLTVTSAGAVLNGTNDAVVGPILQVGGHPVTWTVSNYGTIAGGGGSFSGSGIVFETGGAVTNGQGGLISGSFAGIDIIGAGYPNNVVNVGTIAGSVAGVYIKGAGNTSLTNGASGAGGATISGGSVGVDINGGGGNFTVNNFGAIPGGGTHS